jgi:hypothetical protein
MGIEIDCGDVVRAILKRVIATVEIYAADF